MDSILRKIEPQSLSYESSGIISEVLDKAHEALTEPFPSDRHDLANELLAKLPPILKDVVRLDVSAEQLRFSKQEALDDPAKYNKLLQHAARLQQMPDLAKQAVTPETKQYYRPGLQGIGGYLVSKVSETIWYDEIIKRSYEDRTSETRLITVCGLRFPSDAEVVRKAGGKIIEVFRPDAPEPDIVDPTEAYRKLINSDTRIVSNGDVDNDLYAVGKAVYSDLVNGTLKPIYIADSLYDI